MKVQPVANKNNVFSYLLLPEKMSTKISVLSVGKHSDQNISSMAVKGKENPWFYVL